MSNSKFAFPRLPNDLCSKVIKTMEHHEIIAYSLTSKKALSLVQSLRLPLEKTLLKVNGSPQIHFIFGKVTLLFRWRLNENDDNMTSLDDIPFEVDVVSEEEEEFPTFEPIEFTWSLRKNTMGEWIHHFCSIFLCELYEAKFMIWDTRFDIQILRNKFPNLKRIDIECAKTRPEERDFQNVQNILRVFLPYVQNIRLYGAPLQKSFSFQHIGMANLKELEFDYHWIGNEWNSPKFDDLLTLNVENCTIHKTQFALRDLNRFFKMWTKGSFPKLQSLFILGRSEKDCDILLKGLNAEEAEDSQRLRGDKKFIIKNSGGVCAKMRVEIFGRPVAFHISFAVSK